jgi:MFS family permease
MDLIAILIVTPISDHFHRHCAIFFSSAVCIQIAGLLATTFAPRAQAWARYGGLLMVGFGLGPTVPICMTWTSEIFEHRQGEVGVAAASTLVSGLGNLGSIMTTYALYTGWPEDAARGPHQYRKSNFTMVGILCVSSFVMTFLLKFVGKNSGSEILSSDSSAAKSMEEFEDGAARREAQERGFGKMWQVPTSPHPQKGGQVCKDLQQIKQSDNHSERCFLVSCGKRKFLSGRSFLHFDFLHSSYR